MSFISFCNFLLLKMRAMALNDTHFISRHDVTCFKLLNMIECMTQTTVMLFTFVGKILQKLMNEIGNLIILYGPQPTGLSSDDL